MYIGGQHLCFHLEIHYRLAQPKINNEYRKKIAIVKDGINCINKTDVLIKELFNGKICWSDNVGLSTLLTSI